LPVTSLNAEKILSHEISISHSQELMVSIIISNYNSGASLRRSLISLRETAYPCFEVIVVDGGSTDGSNLMVEKEFPEVRLIRAGRIGIGEAINIGARAAKGDLIVFDFNSDDVAHKAWLSELAKALLSNPRFGAVGCKRLLHGSKARIYSAGSKMDYWTAESYRIGYGHADDHEFNILREVDFVTVILTWRDIFFKLGMVDEDYFIYYEDSDFCYRLREAGYKVAVVPNSYLWHQGSASVGQASLRGYYYLRRNQLRFILKNFQGLRLIVGILYCVVFKTFFELVVILPLIRDLISLLSPRLRGIIKQRASRGLLQLLKYTILWNFRNIKATISSRHRFNQFIELMKDH